MGHIFISYSRKDQNYVNKIAEDLQQRGYDVWFDLAMWTGEKWAERIQTKIDECDIFVVVVSPHSAKAEWVQNEVLYAIQENKTILPLLLDGKLWMNLQQRNYAKIINGVPEKKFFDTIERLIPKNAAWLMAEQERLARQKAQVEQKTQIEKEERERVANEQADKEHKAKAERDRITRQKAEKQKENLTITCDSCGKQNPISTNFCVDCGTKLINKEKLAVICPQCETQNKLSAKHCAACGTELTPSPKIGCDSCGKQNPISANFCVNCGARLINKEKVSVLCYQCETPNKLSAKHCIACGTELLQSRKD